MSAGTRSSFAPALAAGALAAALAASPARADTVVLKGGKKIEGVVVSSEGDPVVINPWNSRNPDMTWEIPDKNRIPRDKVEQVIIADAPLVEYRRRASAPQITAAERVELAKFCAEHKFEEERVRELRLALCDEPGNEDALAALGRGAWAAWAKGNPHADPELRTMEREYLGLGGPAELASQWDLMRAEATTRSVTYLERARRSAKLGTGRRDKVPLTLRSEDASGATYAIHVPKSYDPLVPAGLVIGLHGGGPGGFDPTLVTGSGESALDFYVDVADAWGFIVVCPTALAPRWDAPKNEPLVDALLDELFCLFNVDENRVYVTGHSMGGFGAWHWGPARADLWAAFSPCAGSGGPDTGGLPVYIYHGADDHIVGPSGDRAAAKSLLGDKKKADAVYTELGGVGHGFPDWVRKDIFAFFAGRWKDRGKKRAAGPVSSFDRKVTKGEIQCFGDPSAVPGDEAPTDAKLAELVAALEKGGGRGAEAAKELGQRKDPATAKAVAKVLRSKKTSSDSRVLAARALGEIAIAESVKQLAPAAADEDFRVVDAVVAALGRTGLREAAEPLAKAAKQLGLLWEGSIQGNQLVFTEYEIRCRSFGGLADALAAVATADAALPLLDREIVQRVFAPKTVYTVPVDDRFTHIPPGARLELTQRLRAALVKLADPRGKALLAAVKKAWPNEQRIAAECDAGIAALGG